MNVVFRIGAVAAALIIAALFFASDHIVFGLLFLGVAVVFFFASLLLGKNR
jgi:hypothetical protein